MVEKLRSDISVFYGATVATGDIMTPENGIPIKKRNIKPLETLPPRKD